MAELVTLKELRSAGITRWDIRHRCPWATEYRGNRGVRCYRLEDLLPLVKVSNANGPDATRPVAQP